MNQRPMNHDWTDDIRDKLTAYAEQPPVNDPEQLKGLMAEAARTARLQAIMAWGRRLVAAAAIAAIALPTAVNMLNDRQTGTTATPKASTVATITPSAATRPALAQAPTTGSTAPAATLKAYAAPTISSATTSQTTAETEQPGCNATMPHTGETAERHATTTSEATPKGTPRHSEPHLPYRPATHEASPTAGKPSVRRLRASLAMGSAAASPATMSASPALLAKADPIGWHASQFAAGNSLPTLAQDKPTTTSVSHRQPVTTAISITYDLTRRWSVSAGLSYSYQRSELTATGDNYASQTTRRLHYVGVPLAASYAIWGNNRLSVYATAGATVEKMVSGRDETSTIVDGKEQASTRSGVTIKPLQLSANAAVGAEWQFAPRLSLYAEPGLSYHFDNGSNIATFYADNPLAFSINIGLRLNVNRQP